MLQADLYLDRIELDRYFTPEEVAESGAESPLDLASRFREGRLKPEDCPWLSPTKRYALTLALTAKEWLPAVPAVELPRPVPPELYEINRPDATSPVLVTGNSEFTLTVMTALLATTTSPFYLLLVDCRGDTVDMAMVYASFTPERLQRALAAHNLADRVSHRRLVIPGFCAPLKESCEAATDWEIVPGPICAGELPLFLGDAWQPPGSPA